MTRPGLGGGISWDRRLMLQNNKENDMIAMTSFIRHLIFLTN